MLHMRSWLAQFDGAADRHHGLSHTELHGPRLALAWALLLILALAYGSVFLLNLCADQESALARVGLSAPWLLAYIVGQELLRMLAGLAVALLIVWIRPRDAAALFTALSLFVAGTTIPSAAEALALGRGADLPLDFVGPFGGVTVLIGFYYLFPDGRLVPGWSWLLLLSWVAWGLVGLWLSGTPIDPATWPPHLQFMRAMAWLGSGLLMQVYRYYRVSGPAQRSQMRWVVVGAAVTYSAAIAFVVVPLLFPALNATAPSLLGYTVAGSALRSFLMLALPASMGLAVLRHRLWGIDPLISRTLLYGALTLSVVGIYVLLVGSLSLILRSAAGPLIALVATGVVAVLFQPLRERLQRAVNRLLYGERDDPYTAIARLGRRLEDSLATDAVLPTLVETIAHSLRLPYVAIALRQSDAMVPVAEYPSPAAATARRLQHLPLSHRGEPVGELIVASRAESEPLAIADQRLLADLARQAGSTIHALRLHQELQDTLADLQQSRERLVSAREEERRRLRRDLHDGVGPTLASLVQRIDRARGLIRQDPALADAALSDLKGLVKTTLADIRGLVYALRPPALDELGLVGALRQHAEAFSSGELEVTVEAPVAGLTLSAAVEVAAYRIALEALTNVSRHAHARCCRISLGLDETDGRRALFLEVLDDGVGLPVGRPAGVGMTAMRERTAELGGSLLVEGRASCGTRVYARLPLS